MILKRSKIEENEKILLSNTFQRFTTKIITRKVISEFFHQTSILKIA